jgi:hypothetical protein
MSAMDLPISVPVCLPGVSADGGASSVWISLDGIACQASFRLSAIRAILWPGVAPQPSQQPFGTMA